MIMSEVWKPIFGFEGYEVSNLGRVRSWRIGSSKGLLRKKPKNLCLHTSNNKYSTVGLCKKVDKKSKRLTKLVHRLVLEAFVGPCPEGMECCHNDGDSANNRLDNLRWDTPKNNNADKIKHGTLKLGNFHTNSVHPAGKIIVLKMVLSLNPEDRPTYLELSKIFGINKNTVSQIANNQVWRHIPGGNQHFKNIKAKGQVSYNYANRVRQSCYIIKFIRYLNSIHKVENKYLAEWFDISREQIGSIVKYKSWKNI